MSILGTRVIRTEDPRLLTSGGVYVDDLAEADLAGAARGAVVRSTAADMTALPFPPLQGPLPDDAPPPEGPAPMGGVWQEPLLAVVRVRFVGEPVAIVLTDSTYSGEG